MPAADPRAPLSQRVAASGLLAAWRVVPRLPEGLVHLAGAAAADVAWAVRGPGVRRLEENLGALEPDPRALRRLSRAGMRSYARYWCDAFRLHTWSSLQLDARTRVEGPGYDELVAALHAGRGAVAFLGHSGSWDQVGAWAAAHWGHLGGVLTVAERLEPPAVHEAFLSFRARLGVTAVAVDPAGTDATGAPGAAAGGGGSFAALVRGLRRGAFVPLLADRDLSGSGVAVELLGRASRAAPGPATLALATGAPLFPVSVHYEPGPGRRRGWRPWTAVATVHAAVVVPPRGQGREGRQAQVAAMTRACTAVLSDAVRQHPADWHVLQRVFTP